MLVSRGWLVLIWASVAATAAAAGVMDEHSWLRWTVAGMWLAIAAAQTAQHVLTRRPAPVARPIYCGHCGRVYVDRSVPGTKSAASEGASK